MTTIVPINKECREVPSSPLTPVTSPQQQQQQLDNEEEDEKEEDINVLYRYRPSCFELLKSIRIFLLLVSMFFVTAIGASTVLWASGNFASVNRLSKSYRDSTIGGMYDYMNSNIESVKRLNNVQAAIVRNDFPHHTASYSEANEYAYAYWLSVAKSMPTSRTQVELFAFDANTPLNATTDLINYVKQISYRGMYSQPYAVENVLFWPSETGSATRASVYNLTDVDSGEIASVIRTSGFNPLTNRLIKTAKTTIGTNSTEAWTDAYLDGRSCVYDVYLKRTTCQLRIAHVVSMKNDDGNGLRGLVAYVYTGSVLRDYLKRFTMKYAVSFLIERVTGNLLASTDDFPEVIQNNANGTALLDAEKSENKELVRLVRLLRSKYGFYFETMPKNRVVGGEYNADSKAFQYDAVTVNFYGAHDWILVTYVRVWDVLYTVYIIFIVSVIASGIVMILGIAISLFVSHAVSQPLYRILGSMMMVEDMRLEEILRLRKSYSIFSEVSAIQHHFQTMVETLNEYRSFLPEHILNKNNTVRKSELARYDTTTSRTLTKKSSTLTVSTDSQSGTNTGTRNSSNTKKYDVRFALALQDKTVSTLFIRIPDFFKHVYGKVDYYELVEAHGRMLEKVSKVADATKGQLTEFSESSFTIVWNALTNQKNHATLACRAALELKNFYVELTSGSRLTCTMGISTGNSTIGNMGHSKKRQQITFGKSNMVAKLCAKVTQLIPIQIVMSPETADSIKCSQFQFRPAGFLKSLQYGINNACIYELQSSVNDLVDNEWIYTLEKEKEQNHFDSFEQGFELYANGETATALSIFHSYAEKEFQLRNRRDVLVDHLIEECSRLIEKEIKGTTCCVFNADFTRSFRLIEEEQLQQ
jgi:hypothetical protein